MNRSPTHTARAFTLIEVLVVLAILLIIGAFSLEIFSNFATRSSGESAARTVLGALEEARARSLSGDGDTIHGVHFGSTTVTLFQGDVYSPTGSTNVVRTIRSATIETVDLDDGRMYLTFDRLRGAPSATGSVTVHPSNTAYAPHAITIHKTGLAEL